MQVKDLDRRHPDHDPPALERYQAIYHGGPRFERCQEWFLPKGPQEPTDIYADRRRIAGLYTNESGPIVDRLLAHLFSAPPTLAGGPGAEWWAAWTDSVDRRDTDWAAFWRDRLLAACIAGRSYVWVNLPARPADLALDSRADQERAGLLNAYLVPLDAEEVIDWGEDDVGALAWVMVRQRLCLSDGPATARRTVYRWIAIDSARIRTWEAEVVEGKPLTPETEAVEIEPVAHGFGRLPVVRIELPAGLHALGKLHDPAVKLFRADAALTWSLHRTAHAMMAVHTKDGFGIDRLGPGYTINLRVEDKITWTEPPGASNAALAQSVRDKRDALYRVVDQMAASVDSTATQQARSGESKSQDWASHGRMLAAYAGLALDAMRQTVEIVAAIRGEDEPPAVGGLDGWRKKPTEAVLTDATLALGMGVPSETFKREVHKRVARELLPDAPAELLASVEKEIDEADLASGPFAVAVPRGALVGGEDDGEEPDAGGE